MMSSESVSIMELTDETKPVVLTAWSSGSISSEHQREMKDTVENSPTAVPGPSRIEPKADADPIVPELVCLPGQVCEDLTSFPLCVPGSSVIEQTQNSSSSDLPNKKAKKRRGKAVRAAFRRLFEAVKLPFLCCDPDSVQHLSPQPDTHSVDQEVKSVPGPSRIEPTADADPIVPELVCLPGQVCEDLTPLPLCVPGSSVIEQTHNSSSSDLPNTKKRRGKAVRAAFRRACEAVKHLFPRRVQCPTPEPDLDDPEPVCLLDQDSPDLKSSPVEKSSSEIEQAADDSTQASSVSPDPEIELLQGSVVNIFEVGSLIASGRFSKMYEGTHLLNDRIKIAIKCIPKRKTDRYLDVPGYSKPLLEELALMLHLRQAPSCPNIIKLHRWFENESSFMLIIQKPDCKNLDDYILMAEDMTERKACNLMLQAVQALKHCHERGIYHGDVNSRNFLVTPFSLELMLIDFHCARLISTEGFNSSEYQGSDLYTPPEVIGHTIFHAGPANVWALGVLLFEIMHGYLPFESFTAILSKCVEMNPAISTACHDLIFQCLDRNPDHRLTLEQMEENQWMKILECKEEGASVHQLNEK